ncbi:MAG: hypothetical protein ACYCO3_00135 [Mycobacteriales bacterium]
MDERMAEAIVERLREKRIFAHVERAGVYQFGVRVVLSDGREAIWDTDGVAGLEAVILQDGELVGYVPAIAGSEDLDLEGTIAAIAAADYDAQPPPEPPAHPTPAPAAAAPPTVPVNARVVLPADHPHHMPVSQLLRRMARRG